MQPKRKQLSTSDREIRRNCILAAACAVTMTKLLFFDVCWMMR